MTPERWAQIDEVFHRVVDSDPGLRAVLLEEFCRSDPELLREVEALLAADEVAHSSVRAAVRSEFEAVAFSLQGKVVSHYRILEGMDGGGMGVVYRAEDVKLGRPVAIKFLPEETSRDPVALERFEREARVASTLEHPNICPVYEFGEHEGQPFLVMQLLEGRTLRDLIASAVPGEIPFTLKELLNLAIQISRGLEAAHGRGIIHRDIKPANIFVTVQGEVKILDFGLAKLAQVCEEPKDGQQKPFSSAVDRCLSITGMTMGTVAYMSPEQIRGAELDSRTDLYSFGLVLREMATGRQRVTVEPPSTTRRVAISQGRTWTANPRLRAKLEKIIRRLLEESPDVRYQTASAIRTDLEALKSSLESGGVRWWAFAAVPLVLLAAIASLWFPRRPQPSVVRAPDLKLRQLTSNSAENHVLSGSISPDGKYLVYFDRKGIHLKDIETNETRNLSPPDSLRHQDVRWDLGGWSPDSTRFILNAHRPVIDAAFLEDKDISIWQFAIPGGASRMLRSGAWADSYSPDGSLISFRQKTGSSGHPEIWLMDTQGAHARKYVESKDGSEIDTFLWSPDGNRVSYIRHNPSEFTIVSQSVRGGPVTEITPPLDMERVFDGLELPDARLIFSMKEDGTVGNATCNLWTVRIDQRTGKPIEKPQQLTHWTGFCMSPLSATKDGKRLAFLEWTGNATLYVADLKTGETRMGPERHLTLSESNDFLGDWTRDGKSIVFWSNRDGHNGIYKQLIDEDSPQLLVSSEEQLGVGCVSPDGKWFIYFFARKSKDPAQPAELKRVPLTGGASETILTVDRLEWWECARIPEGPCLLAERSNDRKQAVVTAFDPVKGRGAEVTRIALDPKVESWVAALSPEGKRLAVIRSPGSPLEILSLKGKQLQQIIVPEWSNSGPIKWSADGRGLFVPSVAHGEASLLHVNLQGEIHVLRRNPDGDYSAGAPSPDGKHIVVVGTEHHRNFWMMEKF